METDDIFDVVALVIKLSNDFGKQFLAFPTYLILSQDNYNKIVSMVHRGGLSQYGLGNEDIKFGKLIIKLTPMPLGGIIGDFAVGGYESDGQFIVLSQKGETTKLTKLQMEMF